jgi:hypothetical protein
MQKSNRIYDLIKARYLVSEDSFKNWRLIVYLIFLAMIMIANSHRYEKKSFEIVALSKEVKELRSEFVDRRSKLMKLKMESTISNKMEPLGILPSSVPPTKIKVSTQKESNWIEKIWE